MCAGSCSVASEKGSVVSVLCCPFAAERTELPCMACFQVIQGQQHVWCVMLRQPQISKSQQTVHSQPGAPGKAGFC